MVENVFNGINYTSTDFCEVCIRVPASGVHIIASSAFSQFFYLRLRTAKQQFLRS